MTWTEMADLSSAFHAGRLWLLSKGDKRRMIIADTEELARCLVDDGDTWHCKLATPENFGD